MTYVYDSDIWCRVSTKLMLIGHAYGWSSMFIILFLKTPFNWMDTKILRFVHKLLGKVVFWVLPLYMIIVVTLSHGEILTSNDPEYSVCVTFIPSVLMHITYSLTFILSMVIMSLFILPLRAMVRRTKEEGENSNQDSKHAIKKVAVGALVGCVAAVTSIVLLALHAESKNLHLRAVISLYCSTDLFFNFAALTYVFSNAFKHERGLSATQKPSGGKVPSGGSGPSGGGKQSGGGASGVYNVDVEQK